MTRRTRCDECGQPSPPVAMCARCNPPDALTTRCTRPRSAVESGVCEACDDVIWAGEEEVALQERREDECTGRMRLRRLHAHCAQPVKVGRVWSCVDPAMAREAP